MIKPQRDIYDSLGPPPPEIRLHADPLLRMVTDENGENGVAAFAVRLGYERRAIYSLIENGIELRNAERIAQSLGLHPSHIWGPEYHIAVYMEEERQKIMANRKSQKLSIRRAIARKEKRDAARAQ